jgi:hypothetical protein
MSTSPKYQYHYYTQADLRRRGWTPSLINQLLGEPDYRPRNPANIRQCLRLFLIKRVEQAETTPEFMARRNA